MPILIVVVYVCSVPEYRDIAPICRNRVRRQQVGMRQKPTEKILLHAEILPRLRVPRRPDKPLPVGLITAVDGTDKDSHSRTLYAIRVPALSTYCNAPPCWATNSSTAGLIAGSMAAS